MYVLVHQAIHDPRRFWSRVQEERSTIPPHLTLHQTLVARDGTRATCLWEAESVEAVRDYLDAGGGTLVTNEYAEAENREGIALPSHPSGADAEGIVRSLYDAFNARDYARVSELVAPGAEFTQVATGVTRTAPEGPRELLRGWLEAFPDARVEITSIESTGNRVAVEFTGKGTHTGTLRSPMGEIPPSGRTVELKLCDFFDLEDGKVVGNRQYFDPMALMAQLGMPLQQVIIAERLPAAT